MVRGATRTVAVPIRHILALSDSGGSFLVDRTAAALLVPTFYGTSGPAKLGSGSSMQRSKSR